MRVVVSALFAAGWLATRTPLARAESTRESAEVGDRYDLSARSDTYAELFRRALLPGPNGSLISTNTVAPLYEYVSLRVADLDTAWQKDSLDFELAAWGQAWFGSRDTERKLDGDIQTANVRYRQGRYALRIGRQVVAGGAARFARFDGANVEARLGAGIDANVYGGWTVLPRWNERPSYEHLGATPDSLLRDPAALESVARDRYWLTGGRVGFTSHEQRAGVSFHEQHEAGGLARRNLGFDGRAAILERTALGANALLDLDRRRFADARVWLDASPNRALDVSLEYLHTEPALFLSNQSVLSVFGSAAYDEGGVYATLRTSPFTFDGSGFVQVYAGERPGARSELAVRSFADSAHDTFVRMAYTRLIAPDNGYHSLRASMSRRFALRFRATLEAYGYFYDHAIRGYRASTVYAGTISYSPRRALSVLWGASLARSPYASLDAQTQVRISYAFDYSNREVKQ